MQASFLFLGTGGSLGVPVIGCACEVCHSNDARNQRLRSSGLLTIDGKNFLIDAGPDLRAQALKYRLHHLDGVLLTHSHYDHISGMDDARVFHYLRKSKLPCLLSEDTLRDLGARFSYFFIPSEKGDQSIYLDFCVLPQDFGTALFQEVTLKYFSYFQAGMKVTGFRFGNFAYVSDIREYSEQVFDSLQGVEILVLSALRRTPSPVHFSIQEGIDFAQKTSARQTYFTHIAHDLDHSAVGPELPDGFSLAYDGLKIDFEI